MGMQRIDSASEIDPGIIDFSNICCRYRTGVDTTTGSGVYKKHSYRHGVMTKLGDIEITVWTKIVEQLIEKNDEKWLFDVQLGGRLRETIQIEQEKNCGIWYWNYTPLEFLIIRNG